MILSVAMRSVRSAGWGEEERRDAEPRGGEDHGILNERPAKTGSPKTVIILPESVITIPKEVITMARNG